MWKGLVSFCFVYVKTDADHAEDLALLSNTILNSTRLLHSLERTACDVGLLVNHKQN